MIQYFLAVDTSSCLGSLALFKQLDSGPGELVNSIEWTRGKSHSEVITKNFLDLMNDSMVDSKEISAFLCGVGPGSFTGLRVGLSFAKSLAYSLDIPAYSYCSLQVLAYEGASQPRPVLCLLNAFRKMVYLAFYDWNNKEKPEVTAPCARPVNHIVSEAWPHEILVLGDGLEVYGKDLRDQLSSSIIAGTGYSKRPRAQTLGQMHFDLSTPSQPLSWDLLNPLYIRASEAEEKLHSSLLKPAQKN